MTTYVLVHGAGHGGWCYKRVAKLLRAAGHEVYTPSLTGLAERAHLLTPEVGLGTHIVDVVSLLENEDLKDVILAGHSYGGAVITGAADRALDRVAQLVYLDAAILYDGESMQDVSPALNVIRDGMRMVDGVELVLWPDDPITFSIYGPIDEATWAWMVQRLRPHPWRTFVDKLNLTHPGAIASLPRTVINCPASLARRGEPLERYHIADRDWEIDSVHDLMITEPERTAELLLKLSAL